ncbi:MAG: hypothetical protein A2V64_04600 [Bacteroidetes bacterium RBG_13_43_22]|nr:MAG: hypothetical protein A2V64_04600 [Bacteroidetes bacterium RBG_13_43_22]
MIGKSFIVLTFILTASGLYAQSFTDFSGVWTQDNAKSDDFYKEFNITCIITQTPQTIVFKTTFFEKSGTEITSREASFNLDGKEVSKEEEGGINKDVATWSPDKKTLTTKSTRTVGADVYGSTASYSLSDNGLVLTVKTSDINPGGLSVTQVFNKKQ